MAAGEACKSINIFGLLDPGLKDRTLRSCSFSGKDTFIFAPEFPYCKIGERFKIEKESLG